MKLRRRRKEKTVIAHSSATQLGRSHSPLSLRLLSPLSFITLFSPTSAPPARNLPIPACQPPRVGEP